jgi:hypothetical protein
MSSNVTQTEGFGNRVQRRITGTKREEVAGGWKKLNNEALQFIEYYSDD